MSFPIKEEPPRRYGVIRAHRNLELGFLPDGIDGRWYHLVDIPVKMGDHWVIRLNAWEVRDDGVRAAVYEVQP